ncbi:MAG: prepilin-type N-terminal cleavage/methylation domain-containing protein [Candidatus Sumerlaeia bacterium]|nr:prepilin-type N-terminal cleavage/methylation domain-containing protein [Candidatus Sumerlaeia bacterium]
MEKSCTDNQGVKGFTLVEIMIVIAIIGMIVAIAIPGFMRAREVSRATTCQENLIKIEGAVDSYALENDLTDGSVISGGWTTLVSKTLYLKQTPKCKAGGNYVRAFTVGIAPSCTYTSPGWFNTRGNLYKHIIIEHY